MRWLAVTLWLTALPAGAVAAPRWSAAVGDADTLEVGEPAAMYAACGARSEALESVARLIATRRSRSLEPPSARAIAEMTQAAGVAQPWPRAWSIVSADAARPFAAWLGGGRGRRRCGIARVGEAVAAVTVDALAELRPLARYVRVGAWVPLEARLLTEASDAAVVLLDPGGVPRRILAGMSEQVVRSRFALDAPGAWRVQVLATLPTGPEPVLEALLFAGDAEEEDDTAPDVTDADGVPLPDVQVMMRLSNAERRERGLPPLKKTAELDALALAHAQRMAARGEAVHDAGDGDPAMRVQEAGVVARLVGENVARAADAAAAHRALWASPSHRANMLSTDYGRIGVGVVRAGGAVWVVELFTD